MNEYFVLAFVVMPIVAVAIGYLSLRHLDWELRRDGRRTPTE